MLTRKTLERVNEQRRLGNRLPLAVIGAGSVVVAALLAVLTSSLLAAALALAAGAAGVVAFYRVQKQGAITSVTYGELEGEMKARFSGIQEGFEALCTSEKIWRLRGPVERRGASSGNATLPPPREPARVGLLETPGIRTDVPIWGIEEGDTRAFFFPEAVLIFRDERYVGVQYGSLDVTISSLPLYEKEAVPEDVKVVTKPTRRSRMPVVLYTLVGIAHPRGLDIRLLVSSRQSATRFVRAFGVESRKSPRGPGEAWKPGERKPDEGEKRERTYFDTLTMKERARIASAYKALGVSKGASMEEISFAYKKLARAHHPDKVAMLEPEGREVSERRMKEINAAYTELKRLRRDLTGGAG